MNEALISEVWSELKRFINTVDRAEAAETMISVLIDNDCDVDDIVEYFKNDSEVKRALKEYLDNDKPYDDEDEDDYDDSDPDEWDN
jgi:hypothetical protein